MIKTILAAGLSAAALGAPALAQTTTAATNVATNTPIATTQAPDDLGKRLFDHGISLSMSYTGEAAGNPSGGIRQGTDYTGQFLIGGDFDLNKILGWQGATLHVVVTQRHGRNLAADYIGSNTSVQEVYGTQNTHLAEFTLEQLAFNNRLDLIIGRTPANVLFLTSPLYCQFQSNSACGNPTFIFKDSGFSGFPASAWGGSATWHFNDRTYFQGGVMEVNKNTGSGDDHGFIWDGRGDTGVNVPMEIGYGTSFANDSLPRHYAIGGWYDNSEFADPLYNPTGGDAILTGDDYARHHGRGGMYARFDQMVWRPDPKSQRGLYLLGVLANNLYGDVPENQFYELGLVQQGTFAGREGDSIGLLVDDQEFTSLYLDNIRAARESAGGTGNIPRREIMMEIDYKAQVTPAIAFTPNLQYIVNPDQGAEPYRTKNIPDAFVVGLKFTVDLAKLGGFAPPAS